MLTFDEAAHRYFWDGQPVPNVTSILAPLVSFDHIKPDVLEIARQKGVATHRMVELDCKGDLDEDTLPEWMRPALAQWRKFKAESDFVMSESEHKVFHPVYKFAGTLDLRGTMRGNVVFIDVKRSLAAGPVIGYQISAYEHAYNAQQSVKSKLAKRYALKLSEVGPYRLEEFKDESDFSVFLSCLTVYRAKQKINEAK